VIQKGFLYTINNVSECTRSHLHG